MDEENAPLSLEGEPPLDAEPLPPVRFSWATLWRFTGPGFLMSVAYLDPGNIEADLQAGVRAKDQLLWVLLLATIMGLVLQVMSAKLGCVTGKHLAELCATEFPFSVRIVLWLMAEVAIICVDCQEVLGSAVAIQSLSGDRVPLWGGILMTALTTFAFLFLDQYGVRKLEAVFAVLIGVMSVTFGIQYFSNLPPQGEVLQGTFIPMVSNRNIKVAVGLIGAVIMPHNLYLHSALVLSRELDRSNRKDVQEAIYYNRIESTIALMVSFAINLFVVCVFANLKGCGDEDLKDIGILKADECLSANYASYASLVFSIGLLASGQAATATSTYAGQFVMQGYVNLKVSPWKRSMISRGVAIGPALAVGIAGAHHPHDLDTMMEWLNVAQSVQLPFAILPLLYFANHTKTCGEWVNSKTTRWVGWGIAVVVLAANVYLVLEMVVFDNVLPWYLYILIGVCSFFYLGLVAWLVCGSLGFTTFKESQADKLPLVEDAFDMDSLSEEMGAVPSPLTQS
eukprot:Sspe_Gene.80355::Locus_50695_Transcript_1_1_Confidence_1.000_Length_1707::g.80355::m.80355/K21398/SLC11A2, DMT1, NRAMP2; natural resistance-associated macrophage protein 2